MAERDGIFARMGAFWKKFDRKERVMLFGSLEGPKFLDYLNEIGITEMAQIGAMDRIPLVVLVNTYKEKESQPDFNIFGADPDRERGRAKPEPRREERGRERTEDKPVPPKRERKNKPLEL